MKFKSNVFGVLITCISFITVNAQTQKQAPKFPIDESTKLINYSGIGEITGKHKEELFNNALAWCNTFYKNPNEVIRERDSVAGKIVCKGRYKIMNPPDKTGFSTEGGLVQYTLTILFKEGRYKYDLTEINWKQASYYPAEKWMDTKNSYYKPEYEFYLQQVDDKSRDILKDLDKGVKAVAKQGKSDW
jgi:hypothetical protein